MHLYSYNYKKLKRLGKTFEILTMVVYGYRDY